MLLTCRSALFRLSDQLCTNSNSLPIHSRFTGLIAFRSCQAACLYMLDLYTGVLVASPSLAGASQISSSTVAVSLWTQGRDTSHSIRHFSCATTSSQPCHWTQQHSALTPSESSFAGTLGSPSLSQLSYASGAEAVWEPDSDSDGESAEDEAEEHDSSAAPSTPSQSASSPPNAGWLAMYDQLKLYKQQFGDCLVPRRYWDNPQLGTWASQQRTDAKGAARGTLRRGPSTLHKAKVKLLDDLEFSWKVEEKKARWEANFHELRRYKEEHGHSHVPFKWRDPTYDFNNEFAKWYHAQPALFTQRRLRIDQVRKLKQAEYDMLQVTGEDITATAYADQHAKLGDRDTRVEFGVLFEELKAWKDSYRTTLVPKQVWDQPVLGMWVHRLRRDLKSKTIPQWQVDKLDSIQFAWEVDQISAKWHHNFHEARRYKELHGTANIPPEYHSRDEPGFVEASRWLQRCAKLFNKDRLTENRYWLIRNILGIKFVREYHPTGILEPGARGKARARKKGPKPEVVAKIVESVRYKMD